MSTAQKDFPVLSPNPSVYYQNYHEIYDMTREISRKRLATTMRADEAAGQVVAVLLKRSPPRKAWAGSSGWIFAYIWNFLPQAIRDSSFDNMSMWTMVLRPKLE